MRRACQLLRVREMGLAPLSLGVEKGDVDWKMECCLRTDGVGAQPGVGSMRSGVREPGVLGGRDGRLWWSFGDRCDGQCGRV